MATRIGDAQWLADTLVPTLLSLSWGAFSNDAAVRDAVSVLRVWVNWPRLAGLRERVSHIIRPLLYSRVDVPRADARSLAVFLDEHSRAEDVHSRVAREVGLPVSAEGLTPSAFLNLARVQRVLPSGFGRYLASSMLCRSLDSKKGSLKPMASALRCWATFCDLAGLPHFPISPETAASFAAAFRDPGTYRAYISHIRSACELVRHPLEWAVSPEVARAKSGLLKQALVHKGPRLAVAAEVISRIASVRDWSRVRFFCIFAWVFMLRAASEASGVVFLPGSQFLSNMFLALPADVKGVVGIVDGFLVLRLRSRKTHFFGDSIKRGCTCNGGQGVSIYVPSDLCPIHVLGEWIRTHVDPAGVVFPEGIARDALPWLRISLAARDVPNAERFGLRALRRGAAQALVLGAICRHSSVKGGGGAQLSSLTLML